VGASTKAAGEAGKSEPGGHAGVLTSVNHGGALITTPVPTRTDTLRRHLLETVAALQRRRADLVSEALIADYVALYWLEWNGGTLQLTQTGKNVCAQLRGEARQS
jgi:predicted RNase H-like nuclease